MKKIRVERVEKKNKHPETKTVIFVPQTAYSMVNGYRVKYVEKSGQNLGSQLVRSNPVW